MGSTLQLNLPPALVQSISPARESAAPAEVKELSLTGLLADSVAATGYSEKEAALAQGYEPAYWSRVKSGEKAAHLERVGRLPVGVQREFVARWARRLRMRVTTEDAQRQALAEVALAAVRALQEIA